MIQPGYEGYAMSNRVNAAAVRGRVRSVFDGFRNFGNESSMSLKLANGTDFRILLFSENFGGAKKGKKRTLEDLFKPPIDLTFKGDLQSARDAATEAKKWLMINVQDACEFQCQILNRDVWSNKAVKTILREHFVFWQQYKESDEAQRYMTFYPIHEWPMVTIMDPRTGEQMVTWNKIDASSFCDLVTEFLTMHPPIDSASGASEKPPPAKKQKSAEGEPNILDADEDEQLQAAIRASLAEAETKTKSGGENGSSSKAEEAEDDDSDIVTVSDDDSDAGFPEPVEVVTKTKSQKTNPEVVDLDDPDTGEANYANGSWESYLGSEDDEKTSIILRLPDGKRETKNIPCSSQFKVSSF